ncbi:MAG: manganese efflux pump [Oscillospiraceae bacterium]|nr:manganese efflux pump [Oscillospiraceae bacterium]
MIIIEVILLVAALSADSFAASVSYGLSNIRIGFFRSLLISLVCSAFLLVSVLLADLAEDYIPAILTTFGSFAILFVTGLVKLLQKPENTEPEQLSFLKTILFAVSMSLDGIAAGFGAGLAAGDGILALAVSAPIITFLTVYIGNYVGLRLNRKAPALLQKIGGAVIILIAVGKLI